MRVALALSLLVAAAQLGWAAPIDTDASRPWAAGVTSANQKEALSLFKSGNVFFEESRHVEALARYKSALTSWDHPSIRYNMAVCLVHLDQPLAAYDNLVAALRFGPAPFSTELYAQAQTYKKLLDGQLSRLHVRVSEPGAEVFLDGELLFKAPGEVERIVKPGTHQLSARKRLFLTESQALMLLPGSVFQAELRMLPLSAATKTERRFPVWKPWVVFGAGIAVAVVAAGLLVDTKNNYDAYDRAAASCSTFPGGGCRADSAIAQLAAGQRARGDSEQIASGVLFGVGGATAAAGVILLIANQPRIVERRVSLLPSLGSDHAGFVLTVRN